MNTLQDLMPLLEKSISLDIKAKKRVLDLSGTLTQKQIDELINTFEQEHEEFKKLILKDEMFAKQLPLLIEHRAKEWEEVILYFNNKNNEKTSKLQ